MILAKHDTLLFMISVSVVKFRCTEDLNQLDSILAQISSQKVFSLDVENSPIPQEVATILAYSCFDLIAVHNAFLGKHVKYIVLSLLQMNRLDDAYVYLEFVADQSDRLVCSKASQLWMITDVSEFISDAKKTFLEFTDNALKNFLLNKLQVFGFSEEDALRQLEN